MKRTDMRSSSKVTLGIMAAAIAAAVSVPISAQVDEPITEPLAEPIIERAHPKKRTLLKNFNFLSPHSWEMIPAEAMLIEDDKITAINDLPDNCADCTELDLQGGYVIPGLMDLHQHLNAGGFAKESNKEKIALLRKNLYWGITTVYNPNMNLRLLKAIKTAVAASPDNFPEFIAAGQNIGFTGGWGDAKVSNFQEFRNMATRQLAAGADNIKVSVDTMSWLSKTPLEQFPPFLLKQASQLMRNNKRRIYVHTSRLSDLRSAVDAGVNGVLHGTVDAPIPQALMNQITGRQMGYISTLAWYETISDVKKSVKAMKAYDPDRIHSSLLYDNMGSDLMVVNFLDWWTKSSELKAKLPIARGNTLALVRAGALVGIGSESGTPSIILGSALPFEMHLHEQLGIHPLTVIKLASLNNAKIMNIDNRTGSIEVGKEADLVLMTQNPAGGIRAVNSLVWTMQNGEITYRRELTSTGQ
jgi:imidazolonepropionase-like amidohydrolase